MFILRKRERVIFDIESERSLITSSKVIAVNETLPIFYNLIYYYLCDERVPKIWSQHKEVVACAICLKKTTHVKYMHAEYH